MAQPLEIVRGTNNMFSLTLTNAQGEPCTLENGQILVFGLKRNKFDIDRLMVRTITNAEDGEYQLELFPKDTEDMEPGRYFYDIGLQDGSQSFYSVIKCSTFTILPNITQLGDGGK